MIICPFMDLFDLKLCPSESRFHLKNQQNEWPMPKDQNVKSDANHNNNSIWTKSIQAVSTPQLQPLEYKWWWMKYFSTNNNKIITKTCLTTIKFNQLRLATKISKYFEFSCYTNMKIHTFHGGSNRTNVIFFRLERGFFFC